MPRRRGGRSTPDAQALTLLVAKGLVSPDGLNDVLTPDGHRKNRILCNGCGRDCDGIHPLEYRRDALTRLPSAKNTAMAGAKPSAWAKRRA